MAYIDPTDKRYGTMPTARGRGIHGDMASTMYSVGSKRKCLQWSREEDAAIHAGAAAGMTDAELGKLLKCSFQAISARRKALGVKRSEQRDEARIAGVPAHYERLVAATRSTAPETVVERTEKILGPLLDIPVRCEKCAVLIVLNGAREGGFWLHCGEPQRVVFDPVEKARREMNPSEPEAK